MSLTAEKRLIALRIVTRIRDIPRHEATLDLAIAAFGERFDEARFVEAAVAKDPAQLLLAYGVQSGLENLQNHLAGLTRDALELVGELSRAEPPNAARDLRRLERLGVITRARCDTVIYTPKPLPRSFMWPSSSCAGSCAASSPTTSTGSRPSSARSTDHRPVPFPS